MLWDLVLQNGVDLSVAEGTHDLDSGQGGRQGNPTSMYMYMYVHDQILYMYMQRKARQGKAKSEGRHVHDEKRTVKN